MLGGQKLYVPKKRLLRDGSSLIYRGFSLRNLLLGKNFILRILFLSIHQDANACWQNLFRVGMLKNINLAAFPCRNGKVQGAVFRFCWFFSSVSKCCDTTKICTLEMVQVG